MSRAISVINSFRWAISFAKGSSSKKAGNFDIESFSLFVHTNTFSKSSHNSSIRTARSSSSPIFPESRFPNKRNGSAKYLKQTRLNPFMLGSMAARDTDDSLVGKSSAGVSQNLLGQFIYPKRVKTPPPFPNSCSIVPSQQKEKKNDPK